MGEEITYIERYVIRKSVEEVIRSPFQAELGENLEKERREPVSYDA